MQIALSVVSIMSNQMQNPPNRVKDVLSKSKLFCVYILFNSQGHIKTGPQHVSLVEVEPTPEVCDQMPNMFTH